MEAATCAAIAEQLDDGQTSVGTRVEIQHLAPSRVGAKIEVVASTSHVDGKLVRFSASAKQDGKLIGSGEITRVVVESERFMARLA